jgi:hypothetical protein
VKTEAQAVDQAVSKLLGGDLVSGDFIVRWARENVTKRCTLCTGSRFYVVRRQGKTLQEVCGCAEKRFVRAFKDKLESRGGQWAWRKGIVQAPPQG